MLSRSRTCSGLQVLQSGPVLLMFGRDASLAERKGRDLGKKGMQMQRRKYYKIKDLMEIQSEN